MKSGGCPTNYNQRRREIIFLRKAFDIYDHNVISMFGSFDLSLSFNSLDSHKYLNPGWVVSIDLFHSRFGSFLYNGVYKGHLQLSASNVIVSQKGSNGEWREPFFDSTVILHCTSINNSEKITKNYVKTGYYDVMVCDWLVCGIWCPCW